MSCTQIPLKQLSITDFAIVAKDGLSCDVTTVDLPESYEKI